MTRETHIENNMLLKANPLFGNPLKSWDNVAKAVNDLFVPLLPYFSNGKAQVHLGNKAVIFGSECEGLEGFARPLYGIVPFIMGGGHFKYIDILREGLSNGTDPNHPEFWGFPKTDQRMVEMTAIAYALASIPDQLWRPLTKKAKENVVNWLQCINNNPIPNCNWHFFRILVNLALEGLEEKYVQHANQQSLDKIESHYIKDGYYKDGAPGRVDYYLPWAYHTYGLIYSALPFAKKEYSMKYKERAKMFAPRFQYWFDKSGRAIPYGRSLIYRFAQSSFWSALVFADIEALPWERIKGLMLRNLRFWSNVQMTDRDGIINLGYTYNNQFICEPYSSSCSPYWSMKAFLALAVGPDHPFWKVREETANKFEKDLKPIISEPVSGMIFQRSGSGTVMFNAGQTEPNWPNADEKYSKFAYNSFSGFNVNTFGSGHVSGIHDSMLVIKNEEGNSFVRNHIEDYEVDDNMIYSNWKTVNGVNIHTIIIPCNSFWHIRIHKLETNKGIYTEEFGFALGLRKEEDSSYEEKKYNGHESVYIKTPQGVSAIVNLPLYLNKDSNISEYRKGKEPQTIVGANILHQKVKIPSLSCFVTKNESILCCAVGFMSFDKNSLSIQEFMNHLPKIPKKVIDEIK